MRPTYMMAILLCLGFLEGCTNHLYTGKILEKDSSDTEREFVLYWTKTDKLIGPSKAGPASLMTQCSLRKISFDEKSNGIVFLGDPGKDFDEVHNTPVTSQDDVCGQYVGATQFIEIGEGPLSINVFCKPVTDEFSVAASKQTYLKAREEPYVFEITKTEKWSFWGEIPDVPPPVCQQNP